jgi:hypothetical protein
MSNKKEIKVAPTSAPPIQEHTFRPHKYYMACIYTPAEKIMPCQDEIYLSFIQTKRQVSDIGQLD